MMLHTTRSLLIAFIMPLLLLTACTTNDDTVDTSPEAKKTLNTDPIVIRQFADEVAVELDKKISSLPKIADATEKPTIILTTFINKTALISANDFEYINKRIQKQLTNPYRSGKVKYIYQAPDADLPRRTAKDTYTLTGDFFRINRNDVNLFYLDYILTSNQTRKTILTASTRYQAISGR